MTRGEEIHPEGRIKERGSLEPGVKETSRGDGGINQCCPPFLTSMSLDINERKGDGILGQGYVLCIFYT
jgi:hypothetical protein